MMPLPLVIAALCGWLAAPLLRTMGITFTPTPLASAIGAIFLVCWIVFGARTRARRG